MKLLKQAIAVMGTVTMIALLIALVAPQRTHALVAALVQIVPGTTTHVGQNESQLVALACFRGQFYCVKESPSDGSECCEGSAYVVPAGYTLVVTDYSWIANLSFQVTGTLLCDGLAVSQSSGAVKSYSSTTSCAPFDPNGRAAHDSHFTTGVRFASGSTLEDDLASGDGGGSSIQGYLIPN